MNTQSSLLGRRGAGLLDPSARLCPNRRPHQILILGLALALTAAAAPGALPATGPAVPGFEAYDQQIPALLEKWNIPGAAVALACRGRIVFARGYGYADTATGRPVQPDTRFRVGSVSKTITAAAVLKLVEQGRLSLDGRAFPLLKYPTPTYAGAARDPRLDDITVRELLSHTAGWRPSLAEVPNSGGVRPFDPVYAQREIAVFLNLTPPASAETILRAMVGQPLQATPGTAWEYCNLDYLALGRLIELTTGRTYESAVQEILGASLVSGLRIGGSKRDELAADEAVYYDYPGAPLGESAFGDGLVPQPYQYSLRTWDASGGWALSAIECLRFLLALEGSGPTPRLLQPATVAAMRTEQFPGSAYGFGWVTSYQPYGDDSGHSGGMSGTRAIILRSSDGVWERVAVFNSRPEDASFTAFESDVYAMLHAVTTPSAAPSSDFTSTTLGWDAWQRRNGMGGAAEAGDADGDGVPDLVEYAAGLNPQAADPLPPASFCVGTDGVPVFTYRRIILAHAVAWTIETTADGRTWQAAAPAAASSVLNDGGTLTVSTTLPGATRARLRVQRLESGATASFEPQNTVRLPVITQQPAGQTVVVAGDAHFSVTVADATALTYAWQLSLDGGINWTDLRDGGAYAGTTTARLTVSGATLAGDGGRYRCVVTNGAGSAVSAAALLTVQMPGEFAGSTISSVLSTGVTVRWNEVAGAIGYHVDVSTDRSFAVCVTGYTDRNLGSATTVVVRGLNANTAYYVRVRAYDGAGNATATVTWTVTTGSLPRIALPMTVATMAGLAGQPGSTDGTAAAARFNHPCAVAHDSGDKLYVADTDNHVIRRITGGTGAVTTIAGLAGSSGSADGSGAAARFDSPAGVAVDGAGNIYVADTLNHTIRLVTPAGVVSTIAGQAGSAGGIDGTGPEARFASPEGLALDRSGNLYVADAGNHTIRRIALASGDVTTVAGAPGTAGAADGVGGAARFNCPSGVAVDAAGTLYVADSENHLIRAVTPAGVVTTLAGSAGASGSADGIGAAARFSAPSDVAVDPAGNVCVVDTDDHTIRRIVPSTREVTTLAGSEGNSGSADGLGADARFSSPAGLAIDGNSTLYIADTNNNTIRIGVLPAAQNPPPVIVPIPTPTAGGSGGGGGAPSAWFDGALLALAAGRLLIRRRKQVTQP